jgi:uncharacterized protein YceH (UPF0502 family)
MNPTMSLDSTPPERSKPAWQPLSPLERRVAGVLVEKAKTTPDNYPMSLNAIRVACNQKSNRFPVMDVEEDAVLDALESLRTKGAVAEVQGSGRVAKYRHYLKEWLDVDGAELAVMAELLLRGAQTVGDLRARASRMTPLPDLATLQKLLDSLESRRLVVALTPRGRGQIVTHNLYLPQELQRLMAEYGTSPAPAAQATAAPATASSSATAPAAPLPDARSMAHQLPEASDSGLAQLRADLEALKDEIRRMRDELSSTAEELRAHVDLLLRFKRDLEG